MKTEEIEARDRAATLYVGTIPRGNYNDDVEIEAKEQGLEIDGYVMVP